MSDKEKTIAEKRAHFTALVERYFPTVLIAYLVVMITTVAAFGWSWWLLLFIPGLYPWLLLSGFIMGLMVGHSLNKKTKSWNLAAKPIGKLTLDYVEQFKSAESDGERIFIVGKIREHARQFYKLTTENPPEEFRVAVSNVLMSVNTDDGEVLAPNGILTVSLIEDKTFEYVYFHGGKPSTEDHKRYVFILYSGKVKHRAEGENEFTEKAMDLIYCREKGGEDVVTVSDNG